MPIVNLCYILFVTFACCSTSSFQECTACAADMVTLKGANSSADCQDDTAACVGYTCENGGTCTVQMRKVICDCPSGIQCFQIRSFNVLPNFLFSMDQRECGIVYCDRCTFVVCENS